MFDAKISFNNTRIQSPVPWNITDFYRNVREKLGYGGDPIVEGV